MNIKMITLSMLAAVSISEHVPALAQGSSEQPAMSGSLVSVLSVSLPEGVDKEMLGKRTLETVALQVMLDRSYHSPGVVDGYMGGNTRRAIRYYRKANGLPAGSGVDRELLSSLVETQSGDIFGSYTITQEDVSREFPDNPADFAAMAKDDRLNYESSLEMFGERFHMDEDFLVALNPDADFSKAGTKIIIVAHGDERLGASIAKVEVRKADKSVAVLDPDGQLIASYPATIGSNDFPSPSGSMKVSAIATEPTYFFNPDSQQWGPDEQLKIAAGPNKPVGGTWIDLGKEGYGIHGSPDPQMVGKRTSHGCVRLTNWDAAELASAVSTGIPVIFV